MGRTPTNVKIHVITTINNPGDFSLKERASSNTWLLKQFDNKFSVYKDGYKRQWKMKADESHSEEYIRQSIDQGEGQ